MNILNHNLKNYDINYIKSNINIKNNDLIDKIKDIEIEREKFINEFIKNKLKIEFKN